MRLLRIEPAGGDHEGPLGRSRQGLGGQSPDPRDVHRVGNHPHALGLHPDVAHHHVGQAARVGEAAIRSLIAAARQAADHRPDRPGLRLGFDHEPGVVALAGDPARALGAGQGHGPVSGQVHPLEEAHHHVGPALADDGGGVERGQGGQGQHPVGTVIAGVGAVVGHRLGGHGQEVDLIVIDLRDERPGLADQGEADVGDRRIVAARQVRRHPLGPAAVQRFQKQHDPDRPVQDRLSMLPLVHGRFLAAP